MKKGYDFIEVEAKIKEFWEKEKIYASHITENIYTIDTPPPTVSGKMHIGHAFSYAQQDFIARFRRMKEGVFYPFGTDDNGLPTERLVEKLKKVKSKELTRADFIELCLKTIEEIRPDFINDWKKIGISADYDVCYSTIDENSRKISQQGFIDLYQKGLVYKNAFPTIWCTECQTAIAQAELEDKEIPSKFSTLKFMVKETGNELHIATTRPELLAACVCVFVHPDDERYKDVVGKTAIVPLFNQEVPIFADESANPEKGTGVLMICSYGDKFDVDAINRFKLEPRIIFNKNGTLNLENYNGLTIKEAQKKILGDLNEKGVIVEQKEIVHSVNVHDKCGTPIEFLPTPQWFIKIMDKKDMLIEQGSKITWYPAFMKKRYDNWVSGLDWDWNISRNRHFGIPIPVWECDACEKIIVPKSSELPVDPLETKKRCPKCGEDAKGETMVLDTWATSSLSPQLAKSLVGDTVRVPFSLRPQAHDIIRTWAFYTITRAFLNEHTIPWNDIVISGMVTRKGEKMSKSKGNGVAPQDVLQEYGADALRYWAAGSNLGSDLDYQENDLIAGKKTVNKLWNASKFVFMNLEGYDGKAKPAQLEKIDSLFLAKLNSKVKEATDAFERYEYSKAKMIIDEFFWKDFTDNYLEIVKKRVYQGEGDAKRSAQYSLYQVLLKLIKLFAPFMPFVTEEIYQTYFCKSENEQSVHVSSWPEFKDDNESWGSLDVFYELLGKVRMKKTESKKSMNSEIILTIEEDMYKELNEMLTDLGNVTNAKEIKQGKFDVLFVDQ